MAISKKILVLSIVYFLAGGALLQAQTDSAQYCPMAVEGATWIIFDDEGFYSPVGYKGSYIIRIEGDSLYEDILYKKMWAANLIHEGTTRPENVTPPYIIDSLRLYGLVRDDTINRRFLGVVPKLDDSSNRKEVLIHDFGIKVGEEMLGVYKLDSVPLDSIIVDTFYGKIRQAQLPPRGDILTIEGIGTSNTGPLCQNPVLPLNSGFRAIIGYCIGSTEECGLDFTSYIITPTLNDKEGFEVYPNPVDRNGILRIDITSATPGIIQCIDSSGKFCFAKTMALGKNSIPLNSYPPGLYALYFQGAIKKVIVY